MSAPPLTRRHLLSSLDEDESSGWTPSQRAAFIDTARRASARRDRAIVEQGERLLAEYQGDGVSNREAFRSFMSDLMARR